MGISLHYGNFPVRMIPVKIENIYNSIINCENNWKATYMATWGYSRKVLLPMKGSDSWEKEIQFGLSASKSGHHIYTPKRLYEILTSKDSEITLGHLQTLFSLFEEFVNEVIDKYVKNCNLKLWKFKNLEKLLRSNPPFSKLNVNIQESEINELRLAKETRNCFIHNNSKVDSKWIDAYEMAYGVESIYQIGDQFELMFKEVENWNSLILSIVTKIKLSIERNY